jgi:hypothetical protein
MIHAGRNIGAIYLFFLFHQGFGRSFTWKSLLLVILGVVTPLSSHSQRMENGDMARSPWMAEGPFSEIGEWRMKKTSSPPRVKNGENFLCEGFTAKPFSILHGPQRVSHFLHGEAILLAPLFPHSPFSILRRGVTTPIVSTTVPLKSNPGQLHIGFPKQRWWWRSITEDFQQAARAGGEPWSRSRQSQT